MSSELAYTLRDQLGEKEAVKTLSKIAGYTEVPPTLTEFINDPYFAGDEDCIGPNLWSIWRDVLNQVFPDPLYSDYVEICLTGSIGSGKSSAALVGMLYDACRICMLKDPHKIFSLMKSTPLVIALMNSTMSLSQSVLVEQFHHMIETSQFFREQQAKAKSQLGRKAFLPNKLSLISGSRGSHAYGRGVIMAILSELNFQGAAVKDQAVQNYVHTSRRIKSRFARGEGLLSPGRLWLDSSRKDETGFLESYMKSIQPRIGIDVLVVSKAIWEAQSSSGKMILSGDTFLVFVGNEHRDPFILDTAPGSALGVADEYIIEVPVEYRVDFELDIYGALRDLAGVPTWSGHKFLSHEGIVRDQLHLKDLSTKNIIELDFYDDQDQLIDYLDLQDKYVDGTLITGLPRNWNYFIHFDLSKGKIGGDLAGVALSCVVGETTVERRGKSVVHTLARDLMFQTPLVVGVRGKLGQELPLSKMAIFVGDLCERGYNVVGVSADGYQSVDLLQRCRGAGIRSVKEISVDRTRDPYDHFKDCLIERRWSGVKHPILLKELLALQDHGKMIDHPEDTGLTKERYSKDLSDAVAGSLYHCKDQSQGGQAITAFTQFSDHLERVSKTADAGLKAQLKQQGLKEMNKNKLSRSKLRNGLRR